MQEENARGARIDARSLSQPGDLKIGEGNMRKGKTPEVVAGAYLIERARFTSVAAPFRSARIWPMMNFACA